MKKFVKGLLFGSIVGGTVALLTTKHNGKKNREKLYENIVSLSEDISTLSNGIPTLQTGTKQLQYRIIPQVKELSEEIMEDLQNFKYMSQPRIKRIQAHLSLLNKHIQEAKKENVFDYLLVIWMGQFYKIILPFIQIM